MEQYTGGYETAISHKRTWKIKRKSGGDAKNKVEEIIVNLASISEENAAQTEQTNSAMTELDNTITTLANASQQLKDIAFKLDEYLEFFTL